MKKLFSLLTAVIAFNAMAVFASDQEMKEIDREVAQEVASGFDQDNSQETAQDNSQEKDSSEVVSAE